MQNDPRNPYSQYTAPNPYEPGPPPQPVYNPYDGQPHFESQPYPTTSPDPFMTHSPPPRQGVYSPPHPGYDPYAAGMHHPTPPPPPQPTHDYLSGRYSADFNNLAPGPPPPMPSITPIPEASPAAYQYDSQEDIEDTGDMPLLRRSSHNSNFSIPTHVPGAFGAQPEEDVNIRYGRIPQRVPRRYKTIKKVE